MSNPSPLPVAQSTVLLVEDDEMLRRMLARALDESGVQVLLAGNGEEALSQVRALPRTISLAVTDISMPVMNGFEFAQALRILDPTIPILFMTGALPASSVGISLREVGARMLLKPFSPVVFTDVVGAMLADGPAARRTMA
jgi:DNA-binding response OmpR family regulator